MPPTAFTLQIPADARYAAIASDAAEKFVELMGGAGADGASFGAALADAVRTLAGGTSDLLTLAFSLQSSGVEAVATSGAGATSVVRQPMAAGQRTRRS